MKVPGFTLAVLMGMTIRELKKQIVTMVDIGPEPVALQNVQVRI